jgi:ACS family hexuronate transporter-like MFS transporter
VFDAYRYSGIAKTWVEARAGALGEYLNQILALKLVNQHGTTIDLNLAELGSLPNGVVTQLQAINPNAFTQLKQLQTTVVQSEMKTAYGIMFAVCALAYLVAWTVMKVLVPRFKKIENL